MAPLSTSSSSRWVPSGKSMLWPTSATARVAAAREPLRPKRKFPAKVLISQSSSGARKCSRKYTAGRAKVLPTMKATKVAEAK